MKILLAGGSGAIGLPLITQLRQSGHDVTAIHRSPDGAAPLAAAGASPLRVDVLDRAALLTAVTGKHFDAFISQLTALKKTPYTHGRLAMTDRLRTEGTSNLLAASDLCGATRFLTQSMMYGYGFGDFGDRVLSEHDGLAQTGKGKFEVHLAAMRSNEEQVLGSSTVEGIALRYGFFYGPGSAGDAFVEPLRRRRLPIVRGAGVKSFVYIEDAASITVAALERGRPSSAYNAVDDEPAEFGEFLRAASRAIGAPEPFVVPSWLLVFAPYARGAMMGNLRLSNALAKQELGWSPVAPTYREGLDLLAKHYA